MSALRTRHIPSRLLYAVNRCKTFDCKVEDSLRLANNKLCQHQVCKRLFQSTHPRAVSIGSFSAPEPEEIETNHHTYATPKEIKCYLDKHVVGQEQAKQRLAVTAYYHKKIVEHNVAKIKPPKWKGAIDIHDAALKSLDVSDNRDSFTPFSSGSDDMEDIVLEKGNIVMVGPSGSGKTLLARTLAGVLKVPFAEWDCTSLTSPGYVGDDVSDVIQRLLQAANWDIGKCEQGIVFLDEADKIARKTGDLSNIKDINGEGVQLTLLKMIEGTQIKVKNKEGNTQMVDTSNILFILAGAFNGIDDIVKKRLSAKAFGLGAPVAENTVKEGKVDILSLYEGQSTQEKKSESDKFLSMVVAEDLRSFGFVPEFVGRIPNIVSLHSIDEDALVRILTEPESSYVKQYKFSFELDDFVGRIPNIVSLHSIDEDAFVRILTEPESSYVKQHKFSFELDECQLEFTDEALRAIAKVALENRTGARSLGSILESILMMPAYEVPQSNIKKVIITEDVVKKKIPATYVYEDENDEQKFKKQSFANDSS